MSTHSNNTPDGHDASDQKLDEQAFAEREQRANRSSPTYDPAEIRKHDDTGRDRLFEGRQQHDEAEKNSEKNRLARDVDRHHHDVDDNVADAGSGESAKRKS
jgi:hypothetical protein